MNDREKDAKLHDLIYGVKPEWRICRRDNFGLREMQWYYAEKEKSLARYGRYAEENSHGCSMQPCVPRKHSAIWDVVPSYTSDIAAAWKVEGDIPEEVQGTYVDQLRMLVVDVFSSALNVYQLRRATPAQIVDALLLTFGVQ